MKQSLAGSDAIARRETQHSLKEEIFFIIITVITKPTVLNDSSSQIYSTLLFLKKE
jgi:hypothetical protein